LSAIDRSQIYTLVLGNSSLVLEGQTITPQPTLELDSQPNASIDQNWSTNPFVDRNTQNRPANPSANQFQEEDLPIDLPAHLEIPQTTCRGPHGPCIEGVDPRNIIEHSRTHKP
jgi:hypothetical protein